MAFSIAFASSLFAKQLAILMVPVFILSFVFAKGVEKLWNKQVLVLVIAMGVITIPLIAMTLNFSSTNVTRAGTVANSTLTQVSQGYWDLYPLPLLWRKHLFWPVALLGILFLCHVNMAKGETELFFYFVDSCCLRVHRSHQAV